MRNEMVEIALYQPDIPPNTATILRFAACLDVPVHIIEPCGFQWTEKSFRRAGMDYIDQVRLTRHRSWRAFHKEIKDSRLVLATTGASTVYTDFAFNAGDILLLGRESAGVPETLHAAAHHRIRIDMVPGLRSLNVAMACAMIAGEALRQLRTV